MSNENWCKGCSPDNCGGCSSTERDKIDNQITPEQLKQIAEYMGYKTAHIHKGRVFYDLPLDMSREYNPLTNPEQLLELIEKTKLCVEPYHGGWWACPSNDYALTKEGSGKTLAEAVCKAVLEMIGD